VPRRRRSLWHLSRLSEARGVDTSAVGEAADVGGGVKGEGGQGAHDTPRERARSMPAMLGL
jgi:hypothetical protein